MTAERNTQQPVPSLPPPKRDIRSACPHPSSLSPLALNSPMNNTFLLPSPSVYDTPSFEAAWWVLCMCVCKIVCEYWPWATKPWWIHKHFSMTLSKLVCVLWAGWRSVAPEQVWKGRTSVWQLFLTSLHQKWNLGQLNYAEAGREHESDGWRRKLWVITKLGMRSF